MVVQYENVVGDGLDGGRKRIFYDDVYWGIGILVVEPNGYLF